MKSRRSVRLLAFSSLVCLIAVPASAQIRVVGSMCNFDVYNDTGGPENEFDIECHGITSHDIYGYWSNYNYGLPTAHDDPGGTSTTVVYSHPDHNTADGGVEHFGIHTYGNNLSQADCKFTWKNDGTAGVNPIEYMPIISFQYDASTDTFTDYLTNPNTRWNQTLYVQRHELELSRNVSLNELMPANLPNLVAQSNGGETELDAGLTAIGPQGTLGGEQFGGSGEDESVVIYYDVYGYNGGQFTQLGTAINAVNAAAAPEPASMAALGIGFLAFVRRRRR